jgi:HK97 family phage prohead protease
MPYYITQSNPQCPNWAVEKEDGELIACHDSKESAIDQAVAVSIADNEEFQGERAAIDSLVIGDYVSWNVLDPKILAEVVMVQGEFAVIRLYKYEDGIFTESDKMMILNVFKLEKIQKPEMVAVEIEEVEESEEEESSNLPDNYRPALAEDVPEGRACGNCIFFDESRVNEDGDKAWCERWDNFVDGGYYCNAWESGDEERAINQEAPAYMRAAARRGLEYYADGQGGSGLVARTISEAREMAAGRVSDNKWIRIAAWISRHLVDLDSPDAQPSSDNYPSPGVVAHLLWGSGPSKRAAQRTLAYAESVVARIRADEESERMTESPKETSRDKWVRAAWAIKANLEGLPEEARNIGKTEVRTEHTTLEIRETGDGMVFEGYAAVFNSPSQPLPFIETIKPGAFKRSLQGRHRMMLLWNHNASEPLASTRNGSLKMVEDDYGLKVTARLANTQTGRDVAELLRSKTIDAMSFGFAVKKDSWSADGNYRTLEEVALHEVSLTSFPAYEGTAGTTSVREKRNIDADQLADSLMKLESGEELDAEQAKIINEVVQKLTKTEEVQEVEGDILALKKKKLDLILKGI